MMSIPGINYSDLYRFGISLGIILIVLPFVALLSLELASPGILQGLNRQLLLGLAILVLAAEISGFVLAFWAFNKWSANQKLLDRYLKAKVTVMESDATRRASPDEQLAKANKEVTRYQAALSITPSPEPSKTHPQPGTDDRRAQKISLLDTARGSKGFTQVYMKIERQVLEYLSRFYPVDPETAIRTSNGEYRVFDGIVKEGSSFKIIEVMLFRGLTVERHLKGLLDRFESDLLVVEESYPNMSISGILAIVSDFDNSGPNSPEAVAKVEEKWNHNSSIKIKTIAIDIGHIDF